LNDILIGCGQITWVRFTPNGAERLSTEEQVLAEIAQAGYDGAPASPEGDRSARETLDLYERFGLRPAPGYIGAAFWNRERRGEILERARQHAAFSRAVCSTELYVAPGGFDYVTPAARRAVRRLGTCAPRIV
jgi:inosose dehydratase